MDFAPGNISYSCQLECGQCQKQIGYVVKDRAGAVYLPDECPPKLDKDQEIGSVYETPNFN